MAERDLIIENFLRNERRLRDQMPPEEWEKQRGPQYRETIRRLLQQSGTMGSGIRDGLSVENDGGDFWIGPTRRTG